MTDYEGACPQTLVCPLVHVHLAGMVGNLGRELQGDQVLSCRFCGRGLDFSGAISKFRSIASRSISSRSKDLVLTRRCGARHLPFTRRCFSSPSRSGQSSRPYTRRISAVSRCKEFRIDCDTTPTSRTQIMVPAVPRASATTITSLVLISSPRMPQATAVWLCGSLGDTVAR